MGRHRRRSQRATIGDALRRIWAPTEQPTDHAALQLSLLDETAPLRPADHLATPPPPPPIPRHRSPPPEPPTPPPPGHRPPLAVVRDDGRHAPATVCVPTGENVHLCYPDGRRIPIDWHADHASNAHRRYVADVPPAATMQPGMVIQAGPLMVPVRLIDDPPPRSTWDDDWVVGGGRRP